MRAELRREEAEYAQGHERPLGSYAVLLSTYGTMVGAGLAAVRKRGATAQPPGVFDLALLALATHKATRLVAKDSVTSVVRAPFTRFEEPAGEGEVNEEVRGRGLRQATGELLSCPFCLGLWSATAFGFAFVLAPRAGRWAAAILAAVAGSDALQLLYSAAKERA